VLSFNFLVTQSFLLPHHFLAFSNFAHAHALHYIAVTQAADKVTPLLS
jgi:hypothetical protein